MDLYLVLKTWCLGIILLLLMAQPKKTKDLYLAPVSWYQAHILQLPVLDPHPTSHPNPNPAKLT
jgi:hypothetical protein